MKTNTMALDSHKLKYEIDKNVKEINPANAREYEIKTALKNISTSTILWFLIKRHKFGIVLTILVVQTILVYIPGLPKILLSL